MRETTRTGRTQTSGRSDVMLGDKERSPENSADLKEPLCHVNLATTLFVDNVTHGDICIFLPGYFQFFHETRIAAASISNFMPGVRVVVATHPIYFNVFHR